MESLAYRNSSTQRSTLFGKLKPCCLAAVQALRRGAAPSTSSTGTGSDDGDLASKIDDIYSILTEQAGYDASVIDASIADYVFFPILPILQSASEPPIPNASPSLAKRRYTARVIESATKCIRVLIQSGWKSGISKENAQRLLVMLATLAGTTRTSDVPEELVVEAYRALAALVKAAGAASSAPLIETNVVPLLAHAVTVMLEGATDSVIPAIQLEALAGIDALYTTVKDLQALASFLPGTVSALVRVVGQPGAHKSPRRVIVRALEVLFVVIVNTLGDLPTRRIAKVEDKDDEPTEDQEKEEPEEEADEEIISDAVAAGNLLPSVRKPSTTKEKLPTVPTRQPLNAAWLKATAGQVKIALTTILKLRNHESEDVRGAVQTFCVGLLDECHASLHESTTILVESAIVTSRPKDSEDSLGSTKPLQSLTFTTLENLAMLYPELGDVIKTTAYNWATSLPRAMQASEEDAKQRSIRNLQQAISVLDSLQIDSTTLQTSLTAALRDSVVTLVLTAEPPKTGAVAAVEAVSDDILALATTANKSVGAVATSTPYKPILLSLGSQKGTRAAVLELLSHVGSAAQQTRLAVEMLDFVRDADGLDQVAAYWLSFELVKAAARAGDSQDSLLDLSSYGEADDDSETDVVFEDLYAFSVSALAAHSDIYDGFQRTDWRMGAIALEVTAYAAAKAKESFRPELIDVLYPIATYLGSTEPQLRSHAVLTLNSIAASCGYGGGSVSELIIDNVDYMLNSVSLRLNTFDISPASTQVLTMMIRLAGPRLVPYLDDVVASIFAALDNYHGYPLFVESLFGVLGEVVQQSVMPQARAMLEAPRGVKGVKTHRKRLPDPSTTRDLVDILDRRQKRRREEEGDESEEEIVRGHPRQPWADADTLLTQRENPNENENENGTAEAEDEEHGAEKRDDDTKPEDPKTPTYALLARITTLTQHYLTSPTASLRKSLLDLLATVAPALGGTDENAFLPLVNTIWPVVVPRLYDGEPYVVVAACHALGALCSSAGDFLSTRIKDEWTLQLAKWCVRARDNAERAVKARSAKTTSKTPPSKSLFISGRPSVIHMHGRASAQKQTAVSNEIVTSAGSTSSTSSTVTASTGSSGLGRFAQAVQIWEAVVGLLTDIVSYVKVEDAVYDAIVHLLEPSLTSNVLARPIVDKAFDALAVVNPDAVWLARYRSGVLSLGEGFPQPPVLEGVQFASLTGY
ncbi:heat repeat protein [Ophiostoma piceae UAMH 11346]|uniref:Heat repeat protein n=1 Tax=Ophiostoma piceae (strain UAMH 11346) TaxID=1262450 RepID=S3CF05_OPHP1|nr:heat repeat protein [Ophiostoma piceae UAMH 11346]